jgi:hypothetical protein
LVHSFSPACFFAHPNSPPRVPQPQFSHHHASAGSHRLSSEVP